MSRLIPVYTRSPEISLLCPFFREFEEPHVHSHQWAPLQVSSVRPRLQPGVQPALSPNTGEDMPIYCLSLGLILITPVIHLSNFTPCIHVSCCCISLCCLFRPTATAAWTWDWVPSVAKTRGQSTLLLPSCSNTPHCGSAALIALWPSPPRPPWRSMRRQCTLACETSSPNRAPSCLHPVLRGCALLSLEGAVPLKEGRSEVSGSYNYLMERKPTMR